MKRTKNLDGYKAERAIRVLVKLLHSSRPGMYSCTGDAGCQSGTVELSG